MRISDWSSDVCSSDLDLQPGEARLLALTEPPPGDRRAVAALAGFRIAEIDEPVPREIRIERDVEQPALPPRVDVGHPVERVRNLTLRRYDPQVALALRSEERRVGKECCSTCS